MPTENGDPIETPAPYALAIMVCDSIHQDPGTGKFFLLGTFAQISASHFPAVHPMLVVYVALTDGRGTTKVKLRIIDADEERDPLFEAEIDVEFIDPRMVSEGVYVIRGISFPEPGEYRFQLFAGNTFIIERRIILIGPPDDQDAKS